jgi:N-acyl homoserine lactone hydrolase
VRRCATLIAATLIVFSWAERGHGAPALQARSEAVKTTRLYVFDCGTLETSDPARYRLKLEEVATIKMSIACFLVAHPKGTLMWDTGAVPDSAWKPDGSRVTQAVVLPDSQRREVAITRSLNAQLSEAGHSPGNVTYLALSHYHWDHTANANAFKGATWLVRRVERDAMFAQSPPSLLQPATYADLRRSKTVLISNDEHDVFGDGTVIIKSAPGHTPGHQVLFLKLANTGGVLLSGDLYHYPEERSLGRVPTFEIDQQQTSASRAIIEAFLAQRGARLWIQHDFAADSRLKKAPSFYD